MTCGNLVYPCRVCDQTTAHTDQICVTVSQDTLSDLRITDITHGDTWLVEFFFYGLCHVGTPSVREIICIDLVLDGTVKSAGNIEDINLFLKIISSALRRSMIGKKGPTCFLTSSMTIRQKRVRFSTDPPNSSVRLFVIGERN